MLIKAFHLGQRTSWGEEQIQDREQVGLTNEAIEVNF